MSFNLLDLVKDQVTGSLVEKATGMLGESEGGIQKALGGIFPSVLGSLISKGSDAEGASGLMDMVKGVDPSALGDIGGLFGGDNDDQPDSMMSMGGGMLSSLLGNKLGGAVDLVSKMSGIKSGSAMSLFKMATPLLMGLIGKKVSDDGLDASGFMSMLGDQKDFVKDAMPSGMGSLMGLGGLLGSAKGLLGDAAGTVTSAAGAITGAAASTVGSVASSAAGVAGSAASTVGSAASSVGSAASSVASSAASTVGSVASSAAGVAGSAAATTAKAGSSLFKWLIPVILVLGAIYFLTQSSMCKDTAVGDAIGGTLEKGMDMGKDAANATGDMAKGAASATGDMAKGALDKTAELAADAGGAVVSGAEAVGSGLSTAFDAVDDVAKKALSGVTFAVGSAGKQMMDFIEGGGKSGDGSFLFNNLNFDSGSANIAGDSGSEVDNLAAILKAYTTVNIQVDGHTDSDGEDILNMKLSQNRADAVKARLVAQGIDGARISTKGHGEATPVADNGTAEGKAQNRRIEVKIMN